MMTTPHPKHCLLVVDDEPDVCDSVHDLLRREFRVLRRQERRGGARLMEGNEVAHHHDRPADAAGHRRRAAAEGQGAIPQAVRMLFTGYADLESIIAAINQGHIFRFLKKPWQPEELEDAVGEAAAEYERLCPPSPGRARLPEATRASRRTFGTSRPTWSNWNVRTNASAGPRAQGPRTRAGQKSAGVRSPDLSQTTRHF